jgi:cytochrome P450/NADPH-cytochrome P450 reductase
MSTATPAAALEPIPRDPGWPIFGNLFQITPGEVGQHLLARSRHHDGIFELDFAGKRVPFVSSVALASELCDATRFRKIIGRRCPTCATWPATACSPRTATSRTGAARIAS